ncbi:hypothetical protein SM192_01215 [Lactococcus lactis]|nr:hypothetical protein [Lactococcus lactis]
MKLKQNFGKCLEHFWFFAVLVNIIILTLSYITYGTDGIVSLYKWFKDVSFCDNGNLITISTVLIGIYFSLYTYILSADLNSFFSRLNLKEFRYLIWMITIGFVSSMSIVLLSFINDFLYEAFGVAFIIFLYILFVLIFGSLILISIYYALIFKRDLDSRYKSFEESKNLSEEERKLKMKLKDFLEKND